MRKRPASSRLLSQLPTRRASDLAEAVRADKYWRSLEKEGIFAVALTRARIRVARGRLARATGVRQVVVPEGLHGWVRRYRILHLTKEGSVYTATRVLTWTAFCRLLHLGEKALQLWPHLPAFVDREALARAVAGVKA